jgi:hypothetical protein
MLATDLSETKARPRSTGGPRARPLRPAAAQIAQSAIDHRPLLDATPQSIRESRRSEPGGKRSYAASAEPACAARAGGSIVTGGAHNPDQWRDRAVSRGAGPVRHVPGFSLLGATGEAYAGSPCPYNTREGKSTGAHHWSRCELPVPGRFLATGLTSRNQ